MTFPTELGVLTCLTLLAASLWIPYIIGVNMHLPQGINPFQRPHDGSGLPDWVIRANRAHINLLEQGLPFAILILILHQTGGFTTLTYWTANPVARLFGLCHPGLRSQVRIFGKMKGGGVDSAAPFAHLGD
jgi:uncharacterized MAPEG superfamily protein